MGCSIIKQQQAAAQNKTTTLQSVVIVRVRVHGSSAAVKLDGRSALGDLLVKRLEELHQLRVVHFSWQLAHLRHSHNHLFDHLRLLGFADLQSVHWVGKTRMLLEEMQW